MKVATSLLCTALFLLASVPVAYSFTLDTTAHVELIEGIAIAETAQMDFGIVAVATGTLTVSTTGVLTDLNIISFDASAVAAGEFDVSCVAGATYDITLTDNSNSVGLGLSNFAISIDGAADEAGASPWTAVFANANTVLTVGADLDVDASASPAYADYNLDYRVEIVFN